MAINVNSFINEIVDDLTIELASEPSFDKSVLAIKVKLAVKELIALRNYYATSMTDAQIERDIERFYPQVMNVARYDYNLIGAEGEASHSENGISRTYFDRKVLWNGVVAFAGVPKINLEIGNEDSEQEQATS